MDQRRPTGANLLGIILRLAALSVVVGIVMSALDIRPHTLVYHLRILGHRLYALGFGVFDSLFGYLLLGAVVVVPVWLVVRLIQALAGRSGERRD